MIPTIRSTMASFLMACSGLAYAAEPSATAAIEKQAQPAAAASPAVDAPATAPVITPATAPATDPATVPAMAPTAAPAPIAAPTTATAPAAAVPGATDEVAAPAAAAPAEDLTITIAAVGDVMLGSTFPEGSLLPPDDGKELLAEVAPVLTAADLAFGNLEGPLLDGGQSTKCPPRKTNRCFAFRVPTAYGALLKEAGFDVMGLANNHASDFGAQGIESSQRTLDALGIAHSGPVGDVARMTVKGKRIALVAFAPSKAMHDLTDLETARTTVEALKAESDLVIVSFHGGAEGMDKQRVPQGTETFLGENRGDLRAFARTVIDAGAAMVIGHGPHVVRGMEVYKGRLVAYSLGNFATWEKMNLTGPLGETLVLEAKLAADGRFLLGRIHPAKQVKPGGPKWDPEKATVRDIAELSRADFAETAVVVLDDGTLLPPGAAPIEAVKAP